MKIDNMASNFLGKLCLAVSIACAMGSTSFAGFSQFTGAAGYMNIFDINGTGDGAGGYQFGSGWGVGDLAAATTDDKSFVLSPNTNAYTNALAGSDVDRDYWTNSTDAGATAGNDGNKWMSALVFREHVMGAGSTSAMMDFDVSAYTLDSRYNVTAFVKVLDQNNGYAQTAYASVPISGVLPASTITLDVTGLDGQLLQMGFETQGINANPATAWGSATVNMLDLNVVPEPSCLALLGMAGAGLAMILRRRR